MAEPADVLGLIERATFQWHQRFSLAPGVFAPGVHDIEWTAQSVGLPDFAGRTVLDIGTTNGGMAFMAEALGASRVVATDIHDERQFGFAEIRETIGSKAEFVRGSIYQLPELLDGESFDIVIFWGVLYHLRHPLLALDNVRRLAHDRVMIETAISDGSLPGAPDVQLARCDFDMMSIGDKSVWFVPNRKALDSWVRGAGFEVDSLKVWPDGAPERAHVHARVSPGAPPYTALPYAAEAPMQARPLPVE